MVKTLRDEIKHVLSARGEGFIVMRRPTNKPERLVVETTGDKLVIIIAVHVFGRGGDDAVVRLQLRRRVQRQVDHRHRERKLVALHPARHARGQVFLADEVEIQRFGIDIRHHDIRADLAAVCQAHAPGAAVLYQYFGHARAEAHAHAVQPSDALKRFRNTDHTAARVVDPHMLGIGHHGVGTRHQVGRQPEV